MSRAVSSGDPDPEFCSAWEDYYAAECSDALATAAADGAPAVTVDWERLYTAAPGLAEDLVDAPREVLRAGEQTLSEWTVDPIPDPEPLAGAALRVVNVGKYKPIVSELRERYRGEYRGIRGQVSTVSEVTPQIETARFECQRCGTVSNPIDQLGDDLDTPHQCPGCERNGPFILDESRTTRRDHQFVELVDPPAENPQAMGDSVRVHLYDDLAGSVAPGDRVCFYGVITTEAVSTNQHGTASRRQPWELTARGVELEEQAFDEVEPERLDEIEALADREDIADLFVDSLAPGILTGERGDKHKLAIVLSLLGGASADDRDDINVFFVGAPGTGKSHYLNRANEIAPKSINVSGKGATAAGLTASAVQSEHTGDWMLKPGALVLASGGVACIDEFDKMADSARSSMHKAMEDQVVPINKGGINAELTTQTTVIAAANPKGGSFNRFDALNEQVDLGSPILSRFDLIFGMSDPVDEDRDRAIARHQHHRAAGEDDTDQPLDDELMQQYVAFARQHVAPEYGSDEVVEYLADYYADTRQKSDADDDLAPIQARVNDGLRRLAQASARLHLREEITMADAERATTLFDMTLGDTALDEEGNLDGAKFEGRNVTQRDRKQIIREAVDDLADRDRPAPRDAILDRAVEQGVDRRTAADELDEMHRAGEFTEPTGNTYRRI